MVEIPQWVARDVCTLPTVERPLREQEFDSLLTDALQAVEPLGPTRLRMELRGPHGLADRVRDLADRETACCSFFTFTIEAAPTAENADSEHVELDVEVPAAYHEVLDAMAQRAHGTLVGTSEDR